MSFRHDAQACRAILALFEASELPRLRGLWGPSGPTSEAVELVKGGALSSGELAMLRAAFDFWNGQGGATLDALLHTLDLPRARLVCGLVLAVHEGGEAVERWIAEHGSGRGGPRRV